MKRLAVILALVSGAAQADSSSLALQLPTSPMSYQSDSFRAGELDCTMAIGGSTNLELGVLGGVNNVGGTGLLPQTKDIGLFARIVIPLNAPKSRIDCNQLYLLELQQRRLEIQQLQSELDAMKALQEDQTNFEP
jgi:HAMP domain-containing protein